MSRFTLSCSRVTDIRKFGCVAKTQFFYWKITKIKKKIKENLQNYDVSSSTLWLPLTTFSTICPFTYKNCVNQTKVNCYMRKQ